MNGLAATFQRNGAPASVEPIWSMLAAVPHRGLDGFAVHAADAVVLGFAFTATLPEDGPQPIVSPDTGCVLVADLRLDNRAELLARLPDALPRTISDAELLLRAYEAWGIDAFARLLGDFAAIIWDPRSRRMLCVRDPNAQRELYYRVDRDTFVAASEIPQLFQDETIPIAPNHERIRQSLVPHAFFRNAKDSHQTFFEGIWSVPAGHVVCVDDESLSVARYWEFQPPDEIRYRHLDEYAEHFLALFETVVADRLRSRGAIGATLSGGLDSSSIVCTAQELYRAGRVVNHGFVSYSIVYDGLPCDERPFIDLVQAKYGFDARYIECPSASDRLRLDLNRFLISPDADLAEVSAIFAAAQEDGVRTLLTGDVADACVSGSWYVFDSLLRGRKIREFLHYLRAYRQAHGDSVYHLFGLNVLTPLLPLAIQRRLLATRVRRNVARDRHRMVPRWMPETLQNDLIDRHLHDHVEEARNTVFASRARQDEYVLLYPPEASSTPPGYGIDVARPYADRRLHDFLFAIPPETKFAPHPESPGFYAGSKRLLRHAMRGIQPEDLRARTFKIVFNSVFEREVQAHWETYEQVFGHRGDARIARYGYIDTTRFHDHLQRMRSGESLSDFSYIRAMVELETWLRSLENLKRSDFAKLDTSWSRTSPGISTHLESSERYDPVTR